MVFSKGLENFQDIEKKNKGWKILWQKKNEQ